MKRYDITNPFSAEEADAKFKNVPLTHREASQHGFTILRDSCAVYHEGRLIARLIKNVFPLEMVEQTYLLLDQVKGSPDNRKEIWAPDAGQPRMREDNYLSTRVNMVPKEVIKNSPGRADFLGPYRYPGGKGCAYSNWTMKRMDIYEGVLPFIFSVDAAYKHYEPEYHAKQMLYLQTIAEEWKIADTAFTTLYCIKDFATACHRDGLDHPDTLGVMTTFGEFQGAELCWPRFRFGIEYKPGDLLLGQVHELHGNLPLLWGSRLTAVFFARKGMDGCGGLKESDALDV
jgi:Oxygenase domain of the 2OGFeDO superfamily